MIQNEHAHDDRPLILLIGSGEGRGKEYVLRSIAKRYRLWLLQPVDVTWEGPYVAASTIVDNTDPAALVQAARKVAAEHKVSGVFCCDEWIVLPAAHVWHDLGLPGSSPEVVATCRDKHATRLAMASAAVGQPVSILVRTEQEAVAAAGEIGYPVVVKPRGLAGSEGVVFAADLAGLKSAFATASRSSWPGVPAFDVPVLVEEFADGAEISVDSVVLNGTCVPLVVAHKQLGFEPYFEEVGHLVDGADSLLTDDLLLDLLQRCHAALGFQSGVTHSEWRLTSRGPRLIEVNARLGGDMIPYLGKLATGVDLAMAAADICVGRYPDIEPRHRRAAGIRFLYPDQDVEVESVVVRDGGFPAGIHSAIAAAAPGTVLRLPPRGFVSRYGYIIAVADTVEQARATLAGADDLVLLAARPAPARPTA